MNDTWMEKVKQINVISRNSRTFADGRGDVFGYDLTINLHWYWNEEVSRK